ncbi:MAG: hypothetical protein NT074_07925 [Methanomicrobiales archaeon]|jgi:hypothetical protein|nr:hypothetical protein [Methanomicrobiales archaeon]
MISRRGKIYRDILLLTVAAIAGMVAGMVYTDLTIPRAAPGDKDFVIEPVPCAFVSGDILRLNLGTVESTGVVSPLMIVLNIQGDRYTVQEIVYRDGFGWYRIPARTSEISCPDLARQGAVRIVSSSDPLAFPEQEAR